MDYLDLLVKYIRYVGQCEGTDSIENGYKGYSGDQEFTQQEWDELERISAEVWPSE